MTLRRTRQITIWFCLGFSGLAAGTMAQEHAPAPSERTRECHACRGTDHDPGRPRKPRHDPPGDVNRGICPPHRYRWNDQTRAGQHSHVAPWARCGVNDRYSGSFVGGGAAFAKVPEFKHSLFERGRNRRENGCGHFGEGTWGLDYSGPLRMTNVWLHYTHDRSQGGEGAYETDGEPQFLSKLKSHLHRE